MQFKRFYTLYFTKRRTALIVPILLNSQFIRVEIRFTKIVKIDWYKAGYLTQIVEFSGKQNTYISKVCPLKDSLFEMDKKFPYKVQFKPVPYLPDCRVIFYQSTGFELEESYITL